ncbi:MAG: YceI family protein [Flavobacteriales bacterium]
MITLHLLRQKNYLLAIALIIISTSLQGQMYDMTKGKINFTSEAPLENIKAESSKLKGILNLTDNSFAFSVEIKTFEGFNSDLQREHFHENYLESEKFPKARFTGKLIDKFNPDLASQKIRAKGQLEIHGVSKERIIEVTITKTENTYHFTTKFYVALADHGITIPRIVYQKISENISIAVDGDLAKK